MKNYLVSIAFVFLFAGCATPNKSALPDGYTGPTANIIDSVKVYGMSKADFYYVNTVDGNQIQNSRVKTVLDNNGRGANMTPSIVQRAVPVKNISLEIIARTQYAAPAFALINPVYQVKGIIEINPEPGKNYVVRGELGDTYSAVWLEEQESSTLVGKKIEIKGDAKLGVFEN
ncbi:MAG: hypothetical protein RL020_42 [Pseudomonadota bacterium]|jgi:hypothetical protein